MDITLNKLRERERLFVCRKAFGVAHKKIRRNNLQGSKTFPLAFTD